ncbi:MAG: hypothetical protein ACXVHO_03770 [Methanobacterium sp.]
MLRKSMAILTACLIIILVAVGSLQTVNSDSVKNSTLGSDSNGYVKKFEYSFKNAPKSKIAVVSGMHPRETLSKNVSEDLVKNYAISNKVNIVNYIVEVNESYDNVLAGRNKGETLVANYIIPDIAKSGYNVVIIFHDHKKGYGDGFYVATPTMDAKTLAMADKFRKISPEYKYCERDPDKTAKSTSISKVDKPIADSGTPVFVYESPEWFKYQETYDAAYKLVDTAYKA